MSNRRGRRPAATDRRAGRTRRRPGGAGGRDDARRLALGGGGAKASRAGGRHRARRDRRQPLSAAAVVTAAPRLSPAGDPGRGRAGGVAGHRAARARHLRQRSAARDRRDQEISSGAWIGTVVVSVVFAVGLFFVVPVGLTSLIKHQLGSSLLFWLVEGAAADGDLPGLPGAAVAAARPAARVRVPRRRAQGDLLLRGRRRADPDASQALLAAAPALRDELPADRDDHGHLRVRADRAAGLVDPGADPDPRRAADRRAVVRGDQVRRAATAAAAGSARSCTPACSCSG